MKIFGVEVITAKEWKQKMQAVSSAGAGWFNVIRESFSGAFQMNVVADGPKQITAFGAVFACLTLIAGDIAKIGAHLIQIGEDGVKIYVRDVKYSPFLKVLVKPNHFQTWLKFIELWVISKLMYGNAYILKERETIRGMVMRLYVLDPQRVQPLITDSGEVYYKISRDALSGITETSITVPASEIIHDTMISLWHPLVGISPLYACGISATMGGRILANSTSFFGNQSRPGGQLTAPGKIDDVTAARLKDAFEKNFSGPNAGRIFVAGNGMKYEQMAIPANEAQLIEQLKWGVEDVARCFHVPLWKIGAAPEPARTSVESLNQTYYSDCLQIHIESIEAALKVGLELPDAYEVEFDLDNLLRMDTAAMYTMLGEGVKGGFLAPNEARAKLGYGKVAGGDTPYLQQQNFSLKALDKRDAKDDPFGTPKAAPTTTPALPAPAKNEAKEFADELIRQCMEEAA